MHPQYAAQLNHVLHWAECPPSCPHLLQQGWQQPGRQVWAQPIRAAGLPPLCHVLTCCCKGAHRGDGLLLIGLDVHQAVAELEDGGGAICAACRAHAPIFHHLEAGQGLVCDLHLQAGTGDATSFLRWTELNKTKTQADMSGSFCSMLSCVCKQCAFLIGCAPDTVRTL